MIKRILVFFVFWVLILIPSFCVDYNFKIDIEEKDINVEVSQLDNLTLQFNFSEYISLFRLEKFFDSFKNSTDNIVYNSNENLMINSFNIKFTAFIPSSALLIRELEYSVKTYFVTYNFVNYGSVSIYHIDSNMLKFSFNDEISFVDMQYFYSIFNNFPSKNYSVYLNEKNLIFTFNENFSDKDLSEFISSLETDTVSNSIFVNLYQIFKYFIEEDLYFDEVDEIVSITKSFYSITITFRIDLSESNISSIINNLIFYFRSLGKTVNFSYSSKEIIISSSDNSLVVSLHDIENQIRLSLNQISINKNSYDDTVYFSYNDDYAAGLKLKKKVPENNNLVWIYIVIAIITFIIIMFFVFKTLRKKNNTFIDK